MTITDGPRPRKGDVYVWHGITRGGAGFRVVVQRVARDGTWADIEVSNEGERWTKRQRLPLPASFEAQS